jgi:hypothetical protein
MKQLTKVVIAFCLLGLSTVSLAQSTIPASGGNASGSGGSVSYTIGQIVYTAISGPNGDLNQGVQLPFEISVITAVNETSGITLGVSVYPNPANGFVTLKVENYDTEKLTYRLYDMNGAILQNDNVQGNETRIEMGNILPGTYIMKIAENNKEIKVFKIVKK